jgi:hypothetical protein
MVNRYHEGLVKSSAVDARNVLAAQGDLFILGQGQVALADPFLASRALRGGEIWQDSTFY